MFCICLASRDYFEHNCIFHSRLTSLSNCCASAFYVIDYIIPRILNLILLEEYNMSAIVEKAPLPGPLTALSPPADTFYLDQFKNGISVGIQPVTKNRLVFGRAPDCDIQLEHPSISRYHAAVLWSPKNDDAYQKGLFTAAAASDCQKVTLVFCLQARTLHHSGTSSIAAQHMALCVIK